MQIGCKELVLPLNSGMSLQAFILLLYITTLTIVPCSDGIQHSSNHFDKEVLNAEHEHSDSDHQDDCTPFCTCACCGSIVTPPTTKSIVGDKIETSTDYLFHYTFDYSFEFSEGIWHPPSLS